MPADLAAVAGLEARLFDDPWESAGIADLLATSGRRGWVHTDGEGVVDGYVLTGLAGDFAEVVRIGVHPAAQRRGLAHSLLGAALRAARADGADRVLLEVSAVNAAAVAFYTAEGFHQIDARPRYYPDGSDALVLQRPLDGTDRASGSAPAGPSGRMEP